MMNKTYIILPLILSIVFVSCKNNTKYTKDTGNEKTTQKEVVKEIKINAISTKEVNEKMKDDNIVLLDVRTLGEYQGGHIPNAILNNIFDGGFDQKMEKMDKNKIYYVYCKSGSRSMKACHKMKAMGFKNLYNMNGGFMQWQADGLVSE